MTRRNGLDIGRPVIAARALTFDGVTYQAGEVFPWADVGCTERRLELLFASRRVRNAEMVRPEKKAGRGRRARQESEPVTVPTE